MWQICIGGVCIPTVALVPIGLALLQLIWGWVRKNILGIDDNAVPEGSRVIHVTSTEQWKELQDKAKTTKRSLVVDFTASWCGPCRYISPFFHELSIKYPCTLFLKVDVDEMRAISSQCGVTAMPTFQFFKNGSKCDEIRGANKGSLESKVKQYYVEVELPEDENPQEQALSTDGLRQRKASRVIKLESEAQWKEIQADAQATDKLVVVDFTASWCGPCKTMAPIFDELSAVHASSVFVKVDVDEFEALMHEFHVTSLPTFIVFKQGKKVDELSGAIPSALKSMVGRFAAQA
ncbi:TPA: hypothetical protein N0F65_010627 [Lagenidium giganteum]|uniref:Thioredoxin domain-containing protein n=1 Tax=Lagenidium giganteum TaxID=4803 RepID=A0AAV2ZFU0_9STRA|nr:TPA: hypothetical protein N0F65_010627 [Lagenidium giganteum]